MSSDVPGALADINKTIQLKPDMGQAYNQRAMIRLVARDVSGAIKDLDSAIANDYKFSGIYLIRGQLRNQQGDKNGALADFDEAMKRNPNDPQIYAARGSVLLSLNETDRAFADLNYLLNWYETEPNKRIESKKEEDIAKPKFESDSNKKSEPGQFMLGIDSQTVNLAPGDKENLPSVASAYVNRGFINSLRGNADAAITDFTKSIRLDPKNINTFYLRSNALVRTGDLEAALADISRAIQIDPMNGNLRVEHGVILTLLGNTKEAQLDFEMLLKADPTLWQKRIDERLEVLKKALPQNNP
jgi:tetratricopeptide (TPR) repeat protein